MIIIFDFILLISIIFVRNATMKNNLVKEVNNLVVLDFTKDRYNTKIKTSGSYGKVEVAIKNYLDDYAVLLQEVLKDMHDEKLTKVLSYDNYSDDGPEFKKSLTYISDSKKQFNTIDKLISDSEKQSIISYGEKELSNSRQLTIYKELMLNNNMINDFKNTQKTLLDTKVRVNNIYDVSNDVLNFLVKNKSNWKLEKGEIKFKTESLYKQYTNMIKKLNNK